MSGGGVGSAGREAWDVGVLVVVAGDGTDAIKGEGEGEGDGEGMAGEEDKVAIGAECL